jgi:peptide-methionine (S)-S-oxide reductase
MRLLFGTFGYRFPQRNFRRPSFVFSSRMEYRSENTMPTDPIEPTTMYSRRSLLMLSVGALGLWAAGCRPSSAADAAAEANLGPQGTTATSTRQTGKGKNRLDNLPKTDNTPPPGREIATLGAGCFWCVEAIFRDLKGVDKVISGYSGGHVAEPTYEQVCNGTTGHAEVVNVIFDPKVIQFEDVLHIFFTTHDPTTLNRQGPDSGTQYRSAIFFHSEAQKAAAEKVIKEVDGEKIYRRPIVTEVTPFRNFYAAEDYHQDYFKRNPNQQYCAIIIAPKVRKFREKYAHLLKKEGQ